MAISLLGGQPIKKLCFLHTVTKDPLTLEGHLGTGCVMDAELLMVLSSGESYTIKGENLRVKRDYDYFDAPLEAEPKAPAVSEKLVAFLYELMRDEVVPGLVEKITRNSEKSYEWKLSNKHLEAYAREIAERLA